MSHMGYNQDGLTAAHMTIIEIKNQVISHFFDNDSFDMEVDGPKITLSEDIEGARVEVLTSVLSELETLGMIKKVAWAAKSIWLLTQPFDSFNQSITLSAGAAELIADTINSFRDANEISGDICDKTKISEPDIMNIINICHVLLDTDPLDDEP